MSLTAIVKPTHSCNLACRYCYVLDTAERGVMTDETLKRTIEQVVSYNNRRDSPSHFIWHGGEPLLMGVPFFKKARRIQRLHGGSGTIRNGIQTNGTLIGTELLQFCREADDFNLSISLDGPKHHHDSVRCYGSGAGSFGAVERAIRLMRGSGHRHVAVIVVLSRANIADMAGLYGFLKQQRVDAKVNPVIQAGGASTASDLAISPAAYGRALTELFDLWFYDESPSIVLNPLFTILGNVATQKVEGCHFSESCRDSFVSVGPRGDVYPCGRFDGMPEFHLGNINDVDLETLLESGRHAALRARSAANIAECRNCRFLRLCNAGCMHNAVLGSGDFNDRDGYCTAYRMVFQHIEAAVRREISRALRTRGKETRYGRSE